MKKNEKRGKKKSRKKIIHTITKNTRKFSFVGTRKKLRDGFRKSFFTRSSLNYVAYNYVDVNKTHTYGLFGIKRERRTRITKDEAD